MADLKTCNTCGEVKTEDLFRVGRSQCLVCRKASLAAHEKIRPHRLRPGRTTQYKYRPCGESLKEYRRRYQTEYRKSAAEKEKAAARRALHRAVSTGQVIKPASCSRCDATKNIHGHHHDYSQPLSVIWLCAPCHCAEHRRIRKESSA